MTFTSSPRSRSDCLRTAVIQFRTPSRLITAMRPSAIARYTVANEFLRRRNLTEPDTAVRPRGDSENHTALISVSFEELPTLKTRTGKHNKPGGAPLICMELSTTKAEGSRVVTDTNTSTLKYVNTLSTHSRKSSRWRPTLNVDERNSAIFAAVRQKAERTPQNTSSAQESPSRPMVPNQPDNQESRHEDTANTTPPRLAYRLGNDSPNTESRETAILRDMQGHRKHDSEPRVDILSPHSEIPRDLTSPASDVTLYEEPILYSLSQLKGGGDNEAYASCDVTKVHAGIGGSLPTPVARCRPRHPHRLSSDTASSTARTLSMPLQERAKTDDGMLQLKANASKTSSSLFAPRRGHRRKISLNLPVNTSVTTPERSHHRRNFSTRWFESPCRPLSRITITPQSSSQGELELEYKHRHTFIGTACLDDFLELLEVNMVHDTTRHAVTKTFILLASTEQMYARQCSTTPDGWHVVSRTTPDLTSTDYIAQLQVKLGSITLRQFLELIPFDEKDEVGALRVVEAFLAASHLDAKAGIGAESKARAFRNWMLDYESMDLQAP